MAFYCQTPPASRRALLVTGGAFAAWAYLPRYARAANGREPYLIVIILRGALDGLAAAGPAGDPDYAGLHGDIALSLTGEHAALLLDGFFALNPAMPTFARLYKAGQGALVHAVATSYRERSHFDGQDVLESGYAGPGRTDSGWLNRAISCLPAGGKIQSPRGLGVGAVTPLVMRGPAPVLGWAPQIVPSASDDLAARVLDLYMHRDLALAAAFRDGLETGKLAASGGLAGDVAKARGGMDQPNGMRQAAMGVAKLMAAGDGPCVAALAFDTAGTRTPTKAELPDSLPRGFRALMPPSRNSREGSAASGRTRLSSP